ncbi:DUF4232 domain-containing protein [Streptomyces sp. NRRL S-1521]|uniref:DUF4232 domain-containing protein n=1 Tax=Streptomyces sp. NRRL S-1521 TaxID=1609100 RepID=UPI0007477820|nr:DUF4232 domain-containing protein [Streptomyces sp. NRRL S-1521]KUL55003.1 hypothetical protein ADL30_14205 [Streptomyces sp. NRRL S-1521]
MPTSRSRATVLAAAGAAALALSLTACGGNGSGPRAAAPAEATVAVAPAKNEAGEKNADAEAPTVSRAGRAERAEAAGTARSAASPGATVAAAPVCTTEDLKISAARHGGPPYTHIVLTAKNTSGHSCRMTGHPEIQFLESHRENVPPVAKSRPAAPVVLKAGAPAYAMVRLSDGGVDESTEPVSGFSVTLKGGGGTAAVTAPGRGGIAVDPAAWRTGYWTYELRNGADDF